MYVYIKLIYRSPVLSTLSPASRNTFNFIMPPELTLNGIEMCVCRSLAKEVTFAKFTVPSN
ncbi:MAG: hypothetical protein ACTS43_00115 [Candidatus Hodgkinia cicadicola]